MTGQGLIRRFPIITIEFGNFSPATRIVLLFKQRHGTGGLNNGSYVGFETAVLRGERCVLLLEPAPKSVLSRPTFE